VFDVIKVSHHGSIHNTSVNLLSLIDAPVFLVSSNGSAHKLAPIFQPADHLTLPVLDDGIQYRLCASTLDQDKVPVRRGCGRPLPLLRHHHRSRFGLETRLDAKV
jgi:hypothetical protein